MCQTKEKDKNPQKQLIEEEIGNLLEKKIKSRVPAIYGSVG